MRATLLIVVAIIAAATILRPGTAHAHVITPADCQQRAIQQALAVLPATPAEVRTLRLACYRIAARHAVTHRVTIATTRCIAVRDSGMQPTVCNALARAAVRQNRDAWAGSWHLHRLLFHESTWNPNAVNDSSEACGLFQRLVRRSLSPGRGCPWKVSGVGTRNERVHHPAYEQSLDGLRYIAGRYGTPERALAFWQANGSY